MAEVIVEEVITCFQSELSSLQTELTAKEEKYRKTLYAISELPFVHIWQNPFKPILRRILHWRFKKLQKEITEIKERKSQCAIAEVELRKGKYDLAISLLSKMADRFPATITNPLTPGNIDGTPQSNMPNPRFYYFLGLEQKLVILRERKQ